MSKKKFVLTGKAKRLIRLSLAGILLISAVGVALLPERKAEADPLTPTVTLLDSENNVPTIKDTDKIYATGDGTFQFAYIQKESGSNKVAVICGYDFARSLPNGQLVIPDTVDAYKKYTDAQGSVAGYVAVSMSDEFLYYPTYKSVPKLDSNNVQMTDPETGEPLYEEVIDEFLPCFYNMKNQWEVDKEGNQRSPENFYYFDTSTNDYELTTNEIHKRITGCTVSYIANQNVVNKADGTGWELSTAVEKGIFSEAKNIVSITMGDQILGVGNYAFANCANLTSVSFGDGINTLGNYAFSECHNLQTIDLPFNAALGAIGDHAFYNCQGLSEFTLPTGVIKVGDSCFEGCVSLKECILEIPEKNMALNQLGDNIFRNCTDLEYLRFPKFISQPQDVSWYEGCTSLKYISVPNALMNFTDSSTFTFEDFKNQLPKEFYFEGEQNKALHNTSTNNSFAFKYLKDEIYEKVYNQPDGKVVFQVNNNNELIYFSMEDTVKQIEIPGTIGPYQITKIGTDSFKGKHLLEQITIPSSIVEIESEAFKGCHSLTDVIFEQPINVTYIGSNAFDTQVVDPLLDPCAPLPTTEPFLSFTGLAFKDSVPFQYAMNAENYINNEDQPRTYITFYTGWPTNLTVKYNPDNSENELVDYPTLLDLPTIASKNYPYMTSGQIVAVSDAYNKYKNNQTLSDNEKAIINSAINLELPDGITGIKEGLFSNLDNEGFVMDPNPFASPDVSIESVTMNGLNEIDPYLFTGCSSLGSVTVNGNTSKIGDYAFADCPKLRDVNIYSDVQEIGELPFCYDEMLSEIDFGSNDDFAVLDAILYSQVNGKPDSIIEALPSRGKNYGTGTISATELEGINSVKKGAFKDCPEILSVDFSKSNISEIPESCFENTPNIYSVVLNDGAKKIGPDAFKNSNIRYLEIPTSVSVIDNSAFAGDDAHAITFYCEPDSNAAYFASNYPNIIVSDKPVEYHVYFYDEDTTTLLDTVLVKAGESAKSYVSPTKPGYKFVGWYPEPKVVTSEMNTYAKYEKEDEVLYTVKFIDWDDSVFNTQRVKPGENCIEIKDPVREGYKFIGWRPGITNVTEDRIVYAQYEKEEPAAPDKPDEPDDPDNGKEDPDKKPDNNNNNSGNNNNNNNNNNTDPNQNKDPDNGNNNNSNNGNNNNSGNGSSTLYSVMVIDGSGSGSYVPGATVTIVANNAPAGQVFDKWETEEGVSLLKDTLAANYFTMPSKSVTLTAKYKADGSANNNNNNNNNNNSGNNNAVAPSGPNTTVSLTKTGFSNNSLASATVNGSSDNYVLKISDSQTAKAEIEDALLAEYDSLDHIKYVAMDISLYDSTGTAKIQNSPDLKVSVTVPLPDELVQYAGNNKVASVVNGKLEVLPSKFTTINGVTCVNFVAGHFSPYTIFVDTSDLSASTTYTNTPKTGDFTSVKWIVSIGLCALSLLFFALCIPTGRKKKA